MRSRAALLLSIVLGAIAAVMILTWARGRESELLQLSQMKDVLVATKDIPANTIIDEQLVQRRQVPSTYMQPGAIGDVEAVKGRVTSIPIPLGAQIINTYLQDSGRAALAFDVPRGRRAITIAVSDVTGVAGLARPGNFVDILGTFSFGRPTTYQGGQLVYADEKTETRLLLQNLQVAAVEKERKRDRPDAAAVHDRRGSAGARTDGTGRSDRFAAALGLDRDTDGDARRGAAAGAGAGGRLAHADAAVEHRRGSGRGPGIARYDRPVEGADPAQAARPARLA